MKYRLTRRARRDILDIWQYIAQDNEAAADRFIDLLIHHFRLLGNTPHAGRLRDDLREGYRGFPVGQYVILYRTTKTGVSVMHVVHGRRNLQALFSD